MATRSLTSLPSIAARAALIGIAAGLRSMTPIGVLASERNDSSIPGRWKEWPVLRSNPGRIALQLAWVGEVIADKMPGIPPRINPGPLGGRMLMGALAGLAVGTQGKGLGPKLLGGTLGTGGAVAGAWGGFLYRTRITENTGIPDLPLALVEDVAAWAIAQKAIRE